MLLRRHYKRAEEKPQAPEKVEPKPAPKKPAPKKADDAK